MSDEMLLTNWQMVSFWERRKMQDNIWELKIIKKKRKIWDLGLR